MLFYYKWIHSPVGQLKLVASNKGLVAIFWKNGDPHMQPMQENNFHPVLLDTEQQLNAYFKKELKKFSLPLDYQASGTPFQRKVWAALLDIPFGETRSYLQIARQIGHPKAVRAVGAANGKNPHSIIAPCHRVIGANGKLTGFAGGLETKAFLLELESSVLP